MAKIQSVDYEKIPTYAKQIRSDGKEINSQMKNAYSSITNMHSSWYGKRYNELVKLFNNMVSDINEMLALVVQQIPYALETVANNYSQADRGSNATLASNEAPSKITAISISNDVGMKFITSSVLSVQNSVSANFTKAVSEMNSIEASFNQIDWDSEAGTAFKAKFKKLKASLTNSFENINKQFENLMRQAQNDIEHAEKSNTVS